ncbi:MAG: ferredoxin family protein [Planctomycetes bacterium]|nr:ferredoxin family protein [Planctomycetota bacterium]
MTHVVCEPCTDCKYTDCVVVCPVECFYQDDLLLYIDPVDCIDCEACIPECPVSAIFMDHQVPPQWHRYAELNARRSRDLKSRSSGHIIETQPAKLGPRCGKGTNAALSRSGASASKPAPAAKAYDPIRSAAGPDLARQSVRRCRQVDRRGTAEPRPCDPRVANRLGRSQRRTDRVGVRPLGRYVV